MSKNPVWMFFTKIETDASKAQCKECNKILSLGSDRPRLQTVAGLKSHLARYHKEAHSMCLRSKTAKAGHSQPSFGQTSVTGGGGVVPEDRAAVEEVVIHRERMFKNVVWMYFTKIETDSSKAQCKECNKLLSLGSHKPRLQTVAGLKSHLASRHKELHIQYLKRANDNKAERASKKMKMEETVVELELSNLENSLLTENNMTCLNDNSLKEVKLEETVLELELPNFESTLSTSTIESKSSCPDDHEAARRIDKSIMDLIIVDMLPYSIVEGEGFSRLNIGDPLGVHSYTVKSEKYYRTTLMPVTHEKIVKRIKNLLQEAVWVSFTFDGWSNPSKSCSLMSFTAHFVHAAVRRKVFLSALVLDEECDENFLASKFRETIAKWEIAEKVHVGIRDNTENMKSAMNLAGIVDISCVSRNLQLVLRHALFTQPSVEDVIVKAREIVAYFQRSDPSCRQLKEYQLTFRVPEHSLLKDDENRWTSTFAMLERLVEQSKIINLIALEQDEIDTLSNEEWKLAGKIVKLLKPFYTATMTICAEDACISLVIPLVSNLIKILSITSADQSLMRMKAALREEMCIRFSGISSSEPFLAATLIDPRFKDYYFNDQEKTAATKLILDFLSLVHESSASNVSEPVTVLSNDSFECKSVKSETSDVDEEVDLWAVHDIHSAKLNSLKSFSSQSHVPLYEQQLNAYLKEPRLPRETTDVYAYWRCSQYPLLEDAARKYLSAPATVTTSDQLLSAAGRLYADRRELLGDDAEKLLFLNCNIRMLEFDY